MTSPRVTLNPSEAIFTQFANALAALGAAVGPGRDVTVTDLLAFPDAAHGRIPGVHLLRDGAGGTHLYRAHRNAFDPVATGVPVADGVVPLGAGNWRGDFVRFSGGDLPNGEPCRSAGHWNPRHQAEVFQVHSGRVHVLTGVETTGGNIALFRQSAVAGETIVAPAGGWHVTYAADGPAVVFNIYSGPDEVKSLVTPESEKYVRRPPLPVWMTRNEDGTLDCVTSVGRPVVYEVPSNDLDGDWLYLMLERGDVTSMNTFIDLCDPNRYLEVCKVPAYATDRDSIDPQNLSLSYSTLELAIA